MAHFANINEENIVTQVIVVSNSILLDDNNVESEEKGVQFCKQIFGQNSTWVQTSYNSNFRANFAGIGYTYDNQKNVFIPPKPYNSWVLNEDVFQWESPIPYPNDNGFYLWDENNLSWSLVS